MPKKIFKTFLIISIILLTTLSITLIILNFYYKDRFYPGTSIANYNVSGKTKEQATKFLNKKLAKFNNGILFQSKNYNKKIQPELFGVEINLDQTINNAFNKIYSGKKHNRTFNIIKTLIFKNKNPLIYSIQNLKLTTFYQQELLPQELSKQETQITFNNNEFKIINGQEGLILNQKLLTSLINKRISHLSNKEIILPFFKDKPQTDKKIIKKALLEASNLTSQSIILSFENKQWNIYPEELKSWINFSSIKKPVHRSNFKSSLLNFNPKNQNFNTELTIDFDRQKMGQYLAKNIAPQINQKPQNAKLQMLDQEIKVLSPSQKGRELLIDENSKNILANLKNDQLKTELKTKSVGAEINAKNIKALGIKESLGVGQSNFAGSPQNRIHNISNAAEKLNGILIKPEEEFSLVQNLGEINEETGYLPELVIKENKTIPEYGGGLCQIATTIFRAALNSALPITERQSHSYAVQYYEPQGIDAAVYIPHPDLKFYNDTKNYILIQTSTDYTTLYFEFFGTNDGRTVRFEGPEYWDKKPDKSFKAKYSQIIIYPDKTEKKSTFYSFYDNPDKYKHENQN